MDIAAFEKFFWAITAQLRQPALAQPKSWRADIPVRSKARNSKGRREIQNSRVSTLLWTRKSVLLDFFFSNPRFSA